MDELFLPLASVTDPGRNELSAFTRDVESFLGFVIDSPDDFGFLWENDPALLPMARETLREDVPRAGASLRDVIPSIETRRLEAHGLLGRPFRFKLNVLASIARRWEQVRGRLSVRGWFRQMVDAIDAILDSLIDAAAGVGALLKEFKDALASLAPEA